MVFINPCFLSSWNISEQYYNVTINYINIQVFYTIQIKCCVLLITSIQNQIGIDLEFCCRKLTVTFIIFMENIALMTALFSF